MATARRPTAHALLTRHFLRQFLENDLIAPDADRSQTLAVVTAALLCLTLFISALVSSKYMVGAFMTPGLAAALAVNDRFFYLALGMIATALVAAAQWDALALDVRDAAILEPLPVRVAAIRRAKLAAVTILGVAASMAVNVCATFVFPALLMFNFRQASFAALLWLIVTHAVIAVAAALFGYLAVVALREMMLAVLGVRWFSRVSPWVQGALIIVLGGALLLIPAVSTRVLERSFDGWRAHTPPMWFLGAYELAAGGVLIDLPRQSMRPRQADADALATVMYRQRQDRWPVLAARAAAATLALVTVGAAAYAWNARRRMMLAAAPPVWRHGSQVVRWVGEALLRRPAARAGFAFAAAALWRSNTHRLTLACAAAIGGAMAVIALTRASASAGSVSPALLAVQPLIYGALLVGFRHAIRVPAELRANWGFQLAWRDDRRAFVAGVKLAALVGLVLPVLMVLVPLYASSLGARGALLHALLGLAGAIVLIEALMLYYDKVPFTCTYLPSENMKALAPVYAIAFVLGAVTFARLQHEALVGAGGARTLLILGVAFAALRVAAIARTTSRPIDFDEAPHTFQRLGLDG